MSTEQTWSYPGSRWWKFDFHAHTPASRDTAWHDLIGTPDELTPEQWLLKYMEAEIDCVAITDHNSGRWIDRLKSAYEEMKKNPPLGFREVHLFPGVELSVNAGFHLLALFDPEKTTAHVDRLLGKVDYYGTDGDSDGVTRKSATHVVEAILESGGLPIPAHVDDPKGLLRVTDGNQNKAILDANTIGQVLDVQGMLALEVIDRLRPKPRVYTDRGFAWAEVLGSDCHTFRGSKSFGTRFTWVKMARPSLEGLKLALMDGEGISIRRSDDPQQFDPLTLPEHYIESIKISNARFMGRGDPAVLELSPWFNALVGGRGTGKSTVVHCLRLAYRRDNELDVLTNDNEARRTFNSFNRLPKSRDDVGGVVENTSIELLLMRDMVRNRLFWQQSGSEATVQVLDADGWRNAQSQVISPERYPIRVFSQGQIAALAGENQESLLSLIDDAAGANDEKDKIAESQRSYLALCSQIRDLDGKLTGRHLVITQLEDVQRKLERFEATDHAEVLRMYQARMRQNNEIDRQFREVESLSGKLGQFAEGFDQRGAAEGVFDLDLPEDQGALSTIDSLGNAVSAAKSALLTAQAELQTAIAQERRTLESGAWKLAFEDAANKYRELLQSLNEQGVASPSEYASLVEKRQQLEAEMERLDGIEAQRKGLEVKSLEQLQQLLTARRSLSTKRAKFLEEKLANNLYVRISVIAYGRSERAAERSLRDLISVTDDRFSEDILAFRNDTPKKGVIEVLFRNLPDTVESAAQEIEVRIDKLKQQFSAGCRGEGGFGGHFKNYLKREFEKKPEFLDRVMTWYPDDALRVEYSRKGNGQDFQPISQASAGQRAAAMLAFLLAYGDEPIVLDQPEDDLDNYLIYDLVVQQIRDNKLRRQIIAVTHNPNIVVNGDAEMVYALDFQSGQCRAVRSGSLQDREMREEVCRIMEGGREAFERRYRRLGRDLAMERSQRKS